MPIDNLNDLSNDLRKIESEYKKKIEPYRKDLWKFCFTLTRSPWDAEDLVQETLFKSLSVLAKLFQPVNTKAYLFKIATNLWIDQVRKQKNNHLLFDDLLVHDASSAEAFHLLENLEVLVNHLTPTQYVALILTDVLQFKGREVAEIMSTSEGAVYTNVSRARQTMRNLTIAQTKKENAVRDISANEVIEVLLKGFRNKDPELIASLLDENVITDITHSGMEYGKNETKKNSLRDWAEVVQKQHTIIAEYIELWGRPVIIELERKLDNKIYLNNIHYMEMVEDKITYWKFYCFSWDLMQMAAEELEVKLNAEYFYHVF
ncbi:RNA polymerase sigma factor [Sporosarcina sp. ACRSL]|uniref:RNA polymerase sigma factor n=1 Tax=Sporosarcina sp. ACRSL TaxID=2918215 RepID=UPI001EF69100|nr:RNA polymerase sigma factor [Sporosarcina sp. ACRSL]MCG7344098.1 RNA polymerase sigma factor [Sporosarcina sp. ACRSL]